MLLQTASSLLLTGVNPPIVKHNCLNTLDGCFSKMKNYILLNIRAEMDSRSMPTSNMDLFVAKVAWKQLTSI